MMQPQRKVALFQAGHIVGTPGAFEALDRAQADPMVYLQRHLTGDWGDLDAEDTRANDQAVLDGTRILSAYTLPDETKIWIITEWDRSVTTFLLSSEY